MARPRNDQEGPGARERMQEAFWELLREKSFAKITVGDVARTAQVNRNAFYYHFDNTLDLAQKTIRETLPLHVLRAVMPRLRRGLTPPESMTLDPANEANFKKLRLLVGRHSTPELSGVVKGTMMGILLGQYGLVPDDLDTPDRVGLSFIIGGMFEVVGSSAHLKEAAHPLQLLWSSPVVVAALAQAPAILERATERKAQRLEAAPCEPKPAAPRTACWDGTGV